MRAYTWYSNLIKPSWAPPSWLFSQVWTVLYIIIAVTFGTVFYKAFSGEVAWVIVLPFVLNLVCNFIFAPIQFGLRNNPLAALDVILVVGTLVWALLGLWHHAPGLRWAVYANIPYLLWGTFATCLQLAVTYLNWNEPKNRKEKIQ